MKKYRFTTASRTVLGDIATPVGTYLRVRDMYAQSALMESSDYHGGENSRSFIGLCPVAKFSVNHGVAECYYPDGSVETREINSDYTVGVALSDYLKHFSVTGDGASYCGFFGYTSFNAVRYFENIPVKDSTEDANDAPDMLYIMYKYLIVFRGFKSEMMLVEMLSGDEKETLDQLESAVEKPVFRVYDFKAEGDVTSPLTDEQHKANISDCIAHCLRGDTFQVVISRRFEQKFSGDDFKLYRALRSINPSPYLFYFDFGGFRIFGSSPETHCRIENGRAYTQRNSSLPSSPSCM